jgi:predicted nucleotidyltransferase
MGGNNKGVQQMAERNPSPDILAYAQHLKSKYRGLRKVYLFGSHAKGSNHPESDIDIAAVFEEVADSFDLQVQLMKIRRQYDLRIEPHIFQIEDFDSSHPLASEIIKTGIEIQ